MYFVGFHDAFIIGAGTKKQVIGGIGLFMDEKQAQPISASAQAREHAPKLRTIHAVGVVASVVLVALAILLAGSLVNANNHSEDVHNRYNQCVSASSELMIASDYLTTQCRMFVLTGERSYMDSYFEELLVTLRRDIAVETLCAKSGDERAAAKLTQALSESNSLAKREFYAMRLVCEADGIKDMPRPIENTQLLTEDEALSPTEKRKAAENLVLDDTYKDMKNAISRDVDECATELVKNLEQSVFDVERTTNRLLAMLLVIAFLLMALVLFTVISNYLLVTKPLKTYEADLLAERPFSDVGCYELRGLGKAYNELLMKVNERTAFLRHEAETDALTGVLNRGSYDKIIAEQEGDFALILIDIDRFKEINDKYGHEVGDQVLQRVSSIIDNSFRSTDYVCRIGGDEFAVILPKAGPVNKDAITAKIDYITKTVAQDAEGLPHVTVSSGIAFRGDRADANMYHEADRALYDSKHAGRDRFTVYEE